VDDIHQLKQKYLENFFSGDIWHFLFETIKQFINEEQFKEFNFAQSVAATIIKFKKWNIAKEFVFSLL